MKKVHERVKVVHEVLLLLQNEKSSNYMNNTGCNSGTGLEIIHQGLL